jgi:hypothetical protein
MVARQQPRPTARVLWIATAAEGASLGDVRADAESVATEELMRMNEFASMLATDDFYRTWEQGLRCDCFA